MKCGIRLYHSLHWVPALIIDLLLCCEIFVQVKQKSTCLLSLSIVLMLHNEPFFILSESSLLVCESFEDFVTFISL